MEKKRKVNFYCIRHGDFKGDEEEGKDELTELGKQQITASTTKHLQNLNFNFAYRSNKLRNLQSGEHIVGILSLGIIVSIKDGFSWDYVPDEEWDKFEEVENVMEQGTVFDLLEKWPYAIEIRKRFTQTLFEIAIEAPDLPVTNILVCSHSPLIELSAVFPDVMSFLDPGDIVLHTVMVDNQNEAKLVGSQYLPCPLK